MSLTPSNMLPLGTKAPGFELPDVVSGDTVRLNDIRSDTATVVMFICNHCPYVKHVQNELARLALDYRPKGASFVAISSNDVHHYPADAPEKMKETAESAGYPFPYLYDESLDGATPGNGVPVTGEDLRAALDRVLAGRKPDAGQKPSMGCNIKWKPAA